MGFTLRDIRTLLGLTCGGPEPCAGVKELARSRLADVRARLSRLQQLEATLSGVAAMPGVDCPDGHCHFLPTT